MVVAFRRHTLLPLDDCLYALQPSIPKLTRSALHRCLQRHGTSRLPDMEGDKPKRQKRFNKLISKQRFRVKQCFGTMKRLFGLHRARHFGVAKTHAQLVMAAISQNLLKAANKITLNKQTCAIA
jgi:IS5 family transposase